MGLLCWPGPLVCCQKSDHGAHDAAAKTAGSALDLHRSDRRARGRSALAATSRCDATRSNGRLEFLWRTALTRCCTDPAATAHAQQLTHRWLGEKSREARTLASSVLEQYGAELSSRRVSPLPITPRKIAFWLVAFVRLRRNGRADTEQKHYLTSERPNCDAWTCILLTAADETAEALPSALEPDEQDAAYRNVLNAIIGQARMPECATSSKRRRSVQSLRPPVPGQLARSSTAMASEDALLTLMRGYISLYTSLVERCERRPDPDDPRACASPALVVVLIALVATAVSNADRIARDVLHADDSGPLDLYLQFIAGLGGSKRPTSPLAFARSWGQYCIASLGPVVTAADRNILFGLFVVMRGIRVGVLRVLYGADDAPDCKLQESRIDAIFSPPTPPATPQLVQDGAVNEAAEPARRAAEDDVALSVDLPDLSAASPLPEGAHGLDGDVRTVLSELVSVLSSMFD